jgi:hypothetical protein
MGLRGKSVGRRLVLTAVILAGGLGGVVAPAAVGASEASGIVTGYGVPTYGAPTAINFAPMAIASTATGAGYWVVATDGGIFAYGDAAFFGSTGSMKLNRPVVGMAATPSGKGYWLVASDGGIFAFGDAGFFGSTGSMQLNRPIVGMAATPSGKGYWLVASDGGIFAFGDAGFFGSTGSIALESPVIQMAATPTGKGYWMVAVDGGVFALGDATFHGSAGGRELGTNVMAITAAPDGHGYRIVAGNGTVLAFGSATPVDSTVDAHRYVVAAARPAAGATSGLWLLSSKPTGYYRCDSDPRGDVAGPMRDRGQIDITEACILVRQSSVQIQLRFSRYRPRAEVLEALIGSSAALGLDRFYLVAASGPQAVSEEQAVVVYQGQSGPEAQGVTGDGSAVGQAVSVGVDVIPDARVLLDFSTSAFARPIGHQLFWQLISRNVSRAGDSTDFVDSSTFLGPVGCGTSAPGNACIEG